MGAFADQSAEVMTAHGAGIAVTAGNGASGTPVDLTAHRGKHISLRFPGKTHYRFGPDASVATATTDAYLTADELQVFKIIDGFEFLVAWGVGAAHAGVAAVVSR